jgi:hypothetical protein
MSTRKRGSGIAVRARDERREERGERREERLLL